MTYTLAVYEGESIWIKRSVVDKLHQQLWPDDKERSSRLGIRWRAKNSTTVASILPIFLSQRLYRVLLIQQQKFRFHRKQGISRLADQLLDSQEGL